MQPLDLVDVLAQNVRLHSLGAEHVVRDQEELLALNPGVVPINDGCQLRNRPHRRVVLQQQIERAMKWLLPLPKLPCR